MFVWICVNKGSVYLELEYGWFIDDDFICDDLMFLWVMKKIVILEDLDSQFMFEDFEDDDLMLEIDWI